MADEKIFIISLRKEVLKTPIYKRAKKAISTVKNYIKKHLKVEEVKLGENLNKKIWEKGSKKPPGKIKVTAIKKKRKKKQKEINPKKHEEKTKEERIVSDDKKAKAPL